MNQSCETTYRVLIARWTRRKSKSFLLLFTAITAVMLSGCASMSESECLTADWQLIGYEDGAAGKNTNTLTSRRKACAEYGMTPDLTQYQKGYDEGIFIYCTERNGYVKGKQGSHYDGVCPMEVEAEFLFGFRRGHELFLMNSEIHRKNSQANNRQAKLKRLKSKIDEIEAELIADETTSSRRAILLDDLEDLQLERGKLTSEIRELLWKTDIAEVDICDTVSFQRQF